MDESIVEQNLAIDSRRLPYQCMETMDIVKTIVYCHRIGWFGSRLL